MAAPTTSDSSKPEDVCGIKAAAFGEDQYIADTFAQFGLNINNLLLADADK